MKRGLWITVAGLLVFAAILVARMPASWVIPSGPKALFACASVEGSLWSGACSGLVAQHVALGDLTWELSPASLLRAKLAAHLSLTHGAAHANGDVEAGLGERVTVRNLLAELPLDARLMPGVPQGLYGKAHVDLALAELTHGIPTRLQGTIEAHDLEERSGNVTPLGNFALTFPGAEGDQIGQLRDLGGPLSVSGTVKLTAQGAYEAEGLVGTRAGVTKELADNMRYLGSPDASGRRPFSFSGTF